jgi:hypothetical protein
MVRSARFEAQSGCQVAAEETCRPFRRSATEKRHEIVRRRHRNGKIRCRLDKFFDFCLGFVE